MKLNSIVANLPESETLRLNALANRLAARGEKVFNFTAGELDFSTPKILQREVAGHLRENKYTPVLGSERLRRALALRAVKIHGLRSTGLENIAVTAGAKQGLSEIFQAVLNRGDQVIIPVPAWPSYEQQVKLASGRPIFVPLGDDFDLDAKKIKTALTPRTKAIIINSPHNPTGRIFSPGALRAVAGLLRNRPIYAIADVIYQSLSYARNFSRPADYFKQNLILVDGFSKSHALTGWRIGYVAAAPNIINALGRLQGQVCGNAAVPSQVAALRAAAAPKVAAEFVRALKHRRRLVAQSLARIPRINFSLPDGAFYFFLDISKLTRDSARFCERLLKTTGVALVPGEAFGAPGFARLSFAAPESVLRAGLKRLEKFINHHPL